MEARKVLLAAAQGHDPAGNRRAYDGIDSAFKAAKKIGYEKIDFGTDIITDPAMIARMKEEFTLRTKWFSNFEILRQATANNGASSTLQPLRTAWGQSRCT